MPLDVLFTWELGGGLGHIARLRPLAEAMQRLGRSVAFAVRDVRFCSLVFEQNNSSADIVSDSTPHPGPLPGVPGRGRTDIPWYQAPIKVERARNEIKEPRTYADILHNVGFGDVEELYSLVVAWKNLYAALDPKLVVLDHSPTALLALRSEPTRKSALAALAFFCPPDQTPFVDLRPWEGRDQKSDVRGQNTEALVLDNINTVLRRLGEPGLNRVSQLYAEADETALVTFPELDHFGAREGARYWGTWDSSWGVTPQWPGTEESGTHSLKGYATAAREGARYWGTWDSSWGVVPQWPGTEERGTHSLKGYATAARARVFFYLKPGPLLAALREAIERLKLSAIVYVPELPAAEVRRLVGDAALVLDQPANLRAVFADCDLVVQHATHGVASEALLAGRPLVNLPITLEQFLLARRIEQIPAGLTGNPNDAAAFIPLLQRGLSDARLLAGAQAFATRYQQLDSAQQAEKLAARLDRLTE